MGKGKGNIDKKILKLRKNFILFEFYGVSCYKLRWLANKINKKLNFNFLCIFEKHKEYSWWAYSSKYSFFFKKYNLYINR
jgi:hypothetical protein